MDQPNDQAPGDNSVPAPKLRNDDLISELGVAEEKIKDLGEARIRAEETVLDWEIKYNTREKTFQQELAKAESEKWALEEKIKDMSRKIEILELQLQYSLGRLEDPATQAENGTRSGAARADRGVGKKDKRPRKGGSSLTLSDLSCGVGELKPKRACSLFVTEIIVDSLARKPVPQNESIWTRPTVGCLHSLAANTSEAVGYGPNRSYFRGTADVWRDGGRDVTVTASNDDTAPSLTSVHKPFQTVRHFGSKSSSRHTSANKGTLRMGSLGALDEAALKDDRYVGTKRNAEAAISTSRDMRAEVEAILQIIAPTKAEIKKMLDELENARNELIESNKALHRVLKALPTSAVRDDLYAWGGGTP
ncbi:hypothetical protein O1611_g5419 [Lasiodiplodia mahajangana]|uniref:Uncharacterized protein n=1 Tax=Lasiodiplodia mahajangana TaxID=1108764 RepID=A0ACC2JLT7_9PEZI|nr:hypothetical protein O1611_g5419 [Lasiodiplodia mahajangana]